MIKPFLPEADARRGCRPTIQDLKRATCFSGLSSLAWSGTKENIIFSVRLRGREAF
jgi:hypothetical protein